ncbi:MAG: hypothetical protein CMJ19_18265 [Phycisphaeraceae bacterium]|nr:hypothetical protein [Phycisphaeraceae bacterium]
MKTLFLACYMPDTYIARPFHRFVFYNAGIDLMHIDLNQRRIKLAEQIYRKNIFSFFRESYESAANLGHAITHLNGQIHQLRPRVDMGRFQ